MAKKNHLINVRLTDSQISFLRDLTSDCFDNLSDSIRFAIDLLNVIVSKGLFIDLTDNLEMQEVLGKARMDVESFDIEE